MTEFRYINWYEVAKAMGRGKGAALLINQTQGQVSFGLHPYGNILIADNGHEVNVFWSYIPGCRLDLPTSIEVWEYKLNYSVPLNSICPKQIATAIKAAIDEECAKVIAQQKAIAQQRNFHADIKNIAERFHQNHYDGIALAQQVLEPYGCKRCDFMTKRPPRPNQRIVRLTVFYNKDFWLVLNYSDEPQPCMAIIKSEIVTFCDKGSYESYIDREQEENRLPDENLQELLYLEADSE